jgi:hypothetical protein
MLTGDDELIAAGVGQRSSSGHIVRGRHAAALVYFLASTLLSLDTAAPVPAPLVDPDPGVPPEPTVPEAPPAIPVSAPFAVTSAPFPGTATGSLDDVGEAVEGVGYSPLLAAGACASVGLRSWQAASVKTATIVATASDLSRCFWWVMLNSLVRLAVANRRYRVTAVRD